MYRKLTWKLLPVAALAAATLAASAHAGDAKAKPAQHVWKLPINVSQALKINKQTKATPKLLKKISEQCLDDDCKKQVEECHKTIKTCLLVPTRESVHESETENN